MFEREFKTKDYIIIIACIIFILIGIFIIIYLIKRVRDLKYEAVKLPSKGDKPTQW